AGSSFSQKDALALPSPSLRRRRCPSAGGDCLARWQPPCQGAAAPAVGSAPTGGTSTGVAPLRTSRRRVLPVLAVGSNPCGRRFCLQASRLRAAAPAADRLQIASVCRPLQPPLASLAGWPWPQSIAPLQGSLAVADRPCRGPGRGQPPLHADSMQVVTPRP
ncbi:hypothetical protein BHE74_00031448, partial [Ensete ventricosum]